MNSPPICCNLPSISNALSAQCLFRLSFYRLGRPAHSASPLSPKGRALEVRIRAKSRQSLVDWLGRIDHPYHDWCNWFVVCEANKIMSLMSTCTRVDQAASIVEEIFKIHRRTNGYRSIALMEGYCEIPKTTIYLLFCWELQASSRKSVGGYRFQRRNRRLA